MATVAAGGQRGPERVPEARRSAEELAHQLVAAGARGSLGLQFHRLAAVVAGDGVGGGDGLHARDGADALHGGVEEGGAGGARGVAVARQVDARRQHVRGVEAQVRSAGRDEAADHQRGAHQQHHRQGELPHHQHAAQPTASAGCASAPVAQGLLHVAAGGAQGGDGAEHHARDGAEQEGEEEDGPVHVEADPVRKLLGDA
jgi:hypothetical protein